MLRSPAEPFRIVSVAIAEIAMATIHSGYGQESSTASARRNSGFIELETIDDFRREAHITSTQPSLYNVKSALATSQPVLATGVSTPRRASLHESNIDLTATDPTHNERGSTEPEFSLPPVDGGKDAWLFLFSAFVLEILVWGIWPRPHAPPIPFPG